MANSRYKILVVDDVKDNVTVVTNILQSVGYQTDSVEDGPSAIEFANKNEYDLILLDIMMPIMSGLEVCQYLKENPNTQMVPIIFLTSNADRDTLIKAYAVGGNDYIRKPFFKEELLARVSARLKIRDYEKTLEQKVIQRTQKIAQTKTELMYGIGAIAEGHSPEVYSHLERVAQLSYVLAKLYGLDEEEAAKVRDASTLHDIGKSAIPSSIVNKKTSLTEKEQKEMRKHVIAGHDLLKDSRIELFRIAAIIAEQHHEKYDGTGYPRKRKKERIHLYARIVALADVYDSMTYNKVHKWTQDEILEYIKEMKGKYFDPEIVDIFFNNLEECLAVYDQTPTFQDKEESKKQKHERPKILEWILKKKD